MKVEPRAIKLLKVWNGNPRHDFPEVLSAYRLGMRTLNDHLAVCDMMQVWLLRVPPVPFVQVLGYYVKSLALVEEVQADDQPLLEAEQITAAIDKQTEVEAAWQARPGMDGEPRKPRAVVPSPMPATVRSKEPVKRLQTTYLDGHRRTMG